MLEPSVVIAVLVIAVLILALWYSGYGLEHLGTGSGRQTYGDVSFAHGRTPKKKKTAAEKAAAAANVASLKQYRADEVAQSSCRSAIRSQGGSIDQSNAMCANVVAPTHHVY
jgi:hypothetical protein